MGLMDKVIDRNSGYTCINDFLCYIAYTQSETVQTVITWLYAQDFEQHIAAYNIDNYKVTKNRQDTDSFDASTVKIFKRVQDIAFSIISYGWSKKDENADPDDDDFYYKIEDLNKISYIEELRLNFGKAKDFAYTIYSDDGVTAKVKSNEYHKEFPHVHCSDKSELGKIEDELKAKRKENPIYQNIDWILDSSMTELDDNEVKNQDLKDNSRYSYLMTIGLMLELMQTPKWGLNGDKALFQSQSVIINAILEKLIKGQGKTTLENRFRDANIISSDAE